MQKKSDSLELSCVLKREQKNLVRDVGDGS